MTPYAPDAPPWFGAAARCIAVFPTVMGAYLVFYAAWWPLAWGWSGAAAALVAAAAGGWAITVGLRQRRHAQSFPDVRSEVDARRDRAMGLLNAVTHPLWLVASVVLVVCGQARWVLPVMVFVIGAHFVPIALILGRRIDYLLGPVAMGFAIAAAALALDPNVAWTTVFAVAATGGAVSTAAYATYLVAAYARLCTAAGVLFSPRDRQPLLRLDARS